MNRKDFLTALTNSTPPVIKESYPLHYRQEKGELITMLKYSPLRGLNLAKIRSYFGAYVIWLSDWICSLEFSINLIECLLVFHLFYLLKKLSWEAASFGGEVNWAVCGVAPHVPPPPLPAFQRSVSVSIILSTSCSIHPGEEVAFYFSWMNFYSTFIVIPAIVGVVMYLLRSSNATVDTDPYLPFFSVFMAIWGVLFLVVSSFLTVCGTHLTHTHTHTHTHTPQCWQRRSAVNSFQWNTYNLHLSDHRRPGYHGDIVTDPVTRRQTVYYKSWKRKLWYVFSFLSMLPLLGVGVGVMTLSLNLNGYVNNTASPIYVGSLAKFAQPVSGWHSLFCQLIVAYCDWWVFHSLCSNVFIWTYTMRGI